MGKKGTKRKTRWRVLPIGEDGASGSGNEEEADCDQGASATGSYARATQHRPIRRQNNNRNPGGGGGGGGYYNKYNHHNNPRSYNNHDNSHQPLVTTEKHIFNEEEYTKITTPRQDVLFKKGYLGRKRPTTVATTTTTTESSEQMTSADVINGNAVHYDPSSGHHEGLDNDPTEIVDEGPPQFIYTNGFMDQSGVYYINGSSYEIFDPYSGQVTVVVGPHYGPNGGPPVLAAVPCQPVPLQPLEWFNPPGFLPYVTAPGPPAGLPRDRRKRYSTDSQNCSPQSSESTGPPGSPQESDEVAVTGGAEGGLYPPHHHPPPPPPPYVYPGYMFGAPMYSMNGVTVQSTPNAPPSSDVSGKRRKKKRRRRRRRNGVEDGSEESSSEDKDHEEEPMSVTSQESSLESDSKLSSPGENPLPPVSEPPPPAKSHVHTQTATVCEEEEEERERGEEYPGQETGSSEESVEAHQPSSPAATAPRDVATDTVDIPGSPTTLPHPAVNGLQHHLEPAVLGRPLVNGYAYSPHDYDEVVPAANGERLTNGHDAKPKPERKQPEKKSKNKPIANGLPEKPREAAPPAKAATIEEIADEFTFQDDSFLYTQEFINGNVQVDLDEESEWITVKGHKGSQNKRSDSGRYNDEKKLPSELTNGHAKFNKPNGVSGGGGKDKVPYNNNTNYNKSYNSDKFSKTDKGVNNVKVEERCTYTKAGKQQSESGNKDKTNGRAKLLNGNARMDGNERDDPPVKGREATEVGPAPSESTRDVPKKSIHEVEDTTTTTATPPGKPSRKERKFQKNNSSNNNGSGASPPKTPELMTSTTTLTAMAKPFEMPPSSMVSLRPETFLKKSETTFRPEKSSKEDSLLAALTISSSKDDKTQTEGTRNSGSVVTKEAAPKEGKKPGDATKKTNGNGDKKKKLPQSPDASKVGSVKDLTLKGVEKEKVVENVVLKQEVKVDVSATPPVKSTKDFSQEMIERERRGAESDGGEESGMTSPTPPIPPPRRKRWHPSSKRLSSERAPTPGKGESADEASCSSSSASSSSQESEESVIECLSSGFDSPRGGAKVPPSSGFSSDDDDVIYRGAPDQDTDPKALGRISESLEEHTSGNGKSPKPSDVPKTIPTETSKTPNIPTTEELPKLEVPHISIDAVKTPDVGDSSNTSEEHLNNVRKIAQEIVDSIIQEALAESVRLRATQKGATDPVKLGITDAVTRWLRSQSPDVLSIPRNEDSDSNFSDDDSEADAEQKTDTGPKNLKSNPLPVPSVETHTVQLNPAVKETIGEKDGKGRRVAKTISEKKHQQKDSRNETPDLDNDDAISTSSVSCGEWDHWDCHHTIPQNYDDLLNKRQQKHTKNTNEANIISPRITNCDSSPHQCHSSHPPGQEYPGPTVKYDPLANDTFSPIESTLLSESLDVPGQPHDRCSDMCDPTLSVAKYYVLGANPGSPLSPVEDIEASSDDSDASSLTETPRPGVGGDEVSLAEELARLEQPLPASWAVDAVKVLARAEGAARTRPKHCTGCHCRQQQEFGVAATTVVDSGVESGDEAVVTRKREGMSVFKRRLVGRLKGEGAPFPYGGICCILQ